MIIVVSLFFLSFFESFFKFYFQNGPTRWNFSPTVTILELMHGAKSSPVFFFAPWRSIMGNNNNNNKKKKSSTFWRLITRRVSWLWSTAPALSVTNYNLWPRVHRYRSLNCVKAERSEDSLSVCQFALRISAKPDSKLIDVQSIIRGLFFNKNPFLYSVFTR